MLRSTSGLGTGAPPDPCAVDWLAVQRTMRAWVVGGSQLPAASVYWGQQDSKRAPEPAIEMRILSTHTVGMPWVDSQTAYVTFAAVSVAATIPSANALVVPEHGFTNGDGPVRIASTDTLPAGLKASTDYWVIVLDADRVQLATSFLATGGIDIDGAPSGAPITAVPIGGGGRGTVTIQPTPTTLRAGREIHFVSRAIERVGLMLECHTSAAVGMGAAMSILGRVTARQRLPSQQRILRLGRLGLIEVQRSRAIHGVRNAVMFEPRAFMEVHFSLATEECEDGGIIERVELKDEARRKTIIIE